MITLTFRCGLWNVGGEGQFYSGAIAATITGIVVDAPAIVLIPLEIIAGVIAGCLTAYVPAILKARLHANEILVTLMLNYVPVYLALYVIQGPFSHGLAAKTQDIHAAGELPWLIVGSLRLLVGSLRLHAGLIFVLVSVISVSLLIHRTTFGYKIRAIGSNPKAAQAAGIDVVSTQFWTFLIAGGFGGLAGMIQVAAVHHNLLEGMSAGFGFTAIVTALLGRLQPVGILIASFGFAALVVGETRCSGSQRSKARRFSSSRGSFSCSSWPDVSSVANRCSSAERREHAKLLPGDDFLYCACSRRAFASLLR